VTPVSKVSGPDGRIAHGGAILLSMGHIHGITPLMLSHLVRGGSAKMAALLASPRPGAASAFRLENPGFSGLFEAGATCWTLILCVGSK
jgi:hypothetical protein